MITEVDQIRGKFGNGDLNSSVLTIDLSNVGATPVQPTGLTPNNSFQDLKGKRGFSSANIIDVGYSVGDEIFC